MNILVIPDSHCRHGVGLKRFEWTARLIADRKPEVVVHLGDLFDMESLCSYDKGKKCFEGRRYKRDLEIGYKALDLISGCKAKKVFLIGNHEFRITKAVELEPSLEGVLSFDDLHMKQYGWELVPFLKIKNIAGVLFSHYFISGVMARPIGGENPATSMIKMQLRSCVAGHLHLWDYSERTSGDGRKVQGLMAGCFLEPGQREAYAGPANNLWRNCLTYLHNVEDGQFDVEMLSINRLKRIYG